MSKQYKEDTSNQRKSIKNKNIGDKIFDVFLIIFMLFFSIVVLFPFLNLVALSLNQGMDALKGGILLLPRKFTWENYQIVFKDSNIFNGLKMSVLRTIVGTLTSSLCTGLAAYCFTKKNIVGYKFYLITIMLPMYLTAGLIPTYLTYQMLGLYDSFWVYVIPNLFWAYNILIMRTFYEGIPISLEESAMIDGASEFTIYFRIIFPLSLPVFATISLFNAVWNWNSWFDVVMFTRSAKLETLMSMLSRMLIEAQASLAGRLKDMKAAGRMQHMTPETLRAAMTIVTVIPIVLVYPFLQKYFIKGVLIGSVKE